MSDEVKGTVDLTPNFSALRVGFMRDIVPTTQHLLRRLAPITDQPKQEMVEILGLLNTVVVSSVMALSSCQSQEELNEVIDQLRKANELTNTRYNQEWERI